MKGRVVLLTSEDTGLAHGTELDALAVAAVGDTADAIEAGARGMGWETARVAATRDPLAVLGALREARPTVVFQLAESVGGDARLEAAVAGLLEWADIPYTGPGPTAIALCLEKPLARAVLRANGVPIARGFVLEHADGALGEISGGPGERWIVKPAREDASHGITLDSVVANETDLRARAAWVVSTYAQPALVEEFVDGREFNVAILGSGDDATVLPLAEIDFSRFPAGRPRIVSYAAKWIQDSAEYQGSPSVAAERVPPELARSVRAVALDAYRSLGLAGFGRVDLRVCPRRGPLVIDVNPNPDLSPDAGFAKAAARAEIPHAELIERILVDALARHDRTARALSR